VRGSPSLFWVLRATIYAALFAPSAATADAAGSTGPWSQLLATLLDVTHGKWPLVAILGVFAVFARVQSARFKVNSSRQRRLGAPQARTL
jgi:type IV secretory pathway VirB2 component (pilin)